MGAVQRLGQGRNPGITTAWQRLGGMAGGAQDRLAVGRHGWQQAVLTVGLGLQGFLVQGGS